MDDKYAPLRLKNQLCFPLYAVSNMITRKYKNLLDKLDLTYTQYIVMMVLWEEGQVNEKLLCDALSLKLNTITPLLKKLEAKGYVVHRLIEGTGRTFVYSTLLTRERYVKCVLQDVRDTIFGSSVKNMLSFFVQHEEISDEELREILKLIETNQ